MQDGFATDAVIDEVKKNVKGVTEVTPDEVIVEQDKEKLELELFERTGIKADYVVENRPVHL